MKKVLLGILFIAGQNVFAQTQIKHLTLSEALSIAQEQSLEALEAKNVMHIAYWEYRDYKADLLPNVVLEGTLPNLNRSLTQYQTEDGIYKFIPNSLLSEKLSLSVNQNIPFTGGKISIETQLQRIDQLDGNKVTNYLSVPAVLSLEQPLISYNPLKWARKLEPLKYKEAKKQFVADLEEVSVETVTYYFDCLLSLVNKNIAEQNLENSTKLYDIALGKKTLGLISENELQQLELGKLNASAAVIEASQDYEEKMQSLRNFLGFDDTFELIPTVPDNVPTLHIDYDNVLAIIKRNNPFWDDVARRLLESEMQIAQARSERGFQVDVYASLGFTGSDLRFSNAYKNLQNRQMVSVGLRIPILDWGKGRGKVELARYKQKVEEVAIEKDTRDFEQNVRLLVRQLQEQPLLTDIAYQADSVARNRYKIAFETFVMGQITVLDINAAQTEEDTARRNYINQLYFSWLYYYTLRKFTLYDFERNTDIINNMESTSWTEKYLKR